MAFCVCKRCRAEMNISKADSHICEDLIDIEGELEVPEYYGA